MLQDILKEDVINDLRQELTEPIFNALNQVSNLKRPEYIGSKKKLAKYLDCDTSFIDRVLVPMGLPSIPMTGKKIMYKRSEVDEFMLQYQVNGHDYVPGSLPERSIK